MPELPAAFGATVKGAMRGATQELRDQAEIILTYLRQRAKALKDPTDTSIPQEVRDAIRLEDEYAELVILTDRGVMTLIDVPFLESLEINGEYSHSLQRRTDAAGETEVAVAIGPATVSIGGSISTGREEVTNSTLRISATYRSRSRAEWLAAARDSLPIRTLPEKG